MADHEQDRRPGTVLPPEPWDQPFRRRATDCPRLFRRSVGKDRNRRTARPSQRKNRPFLHRVKGFSTHVHKPRRNRTDPRRHGDLDSSWRGIQSVPGRKSHRYPSPWRKLHRHDSSGHVQNSRQGCRCPGETNGDDAPKTPDANQEPASVEQIKENLKSVFDPEIPVNVVDLGLIYRIEIEHIEEKGRVAFVDLTLTARVAGWGRSLPKTSKARFWSFPGLMMQWSRSFGIPHGLRI